MVLAGAGDQLAQLSEAGSVERHARPARGSPVHGLRRQSGTAPGILEYSWASGSVFWRLLHRARTSRPNFSRHLLRKVWPEIKALNVSIFK